MVGSAYACLMRTIVAIKLPLPIAVENVLIMTAPIIVDGISAVQLDRASVTRRASRASIRWPAFRNETELDASDANTG